MKNKPGDPESLRAEAETRITRSSVKFVDPKPEEELIHSLIHELQVHQIELEMQNEELRRVQISLEESRDRYYHLYEFAPVGYFTLTPEGLITEVNLTGATLLGEVRKNLLNRQFSQFIAAEDYRRWNTYLINAKLQEEGQNCELIIKRVDGTVFHASLELQLGEFDSVKSLRITLANISKRKIAEFRQLESEQINDVLIKSEKRFRRILELAPIGMATNTLDGHFILVNQAFCNMLGYNKNELELMTYFDVTHPDDKTLALTSREKLLSGEIESYQLEKRFIHKNGQVVWGLITSSVEKNNFGAPSFFIAQVEDISARKISENRLRENEENLRAILDNSPYLTWLKDTEGRYLHVNQAYANYPLLKSGKQIIGLTDFDLWPPDIAEKYRADDAEVMANRQQQRPTEECYIDGTRMYWAEVFKTAIIGKDGQVTGTTGFSRDITHRKATEQQLHDLTAHLLNVREEEKAAIAREIHDELGGIMTALKIKIYQLKSTLSETTAAVTLAEPIETMVELINNAAVISRNIIANLHPTILDDLGLLAAIEWQAGEFHKLTGIATMVNSIGDKENLDKQTSIALFRILQEALTNVARHSGASRVGVEYHHSDDEVMLSISDNGCGLPDDRRSQPRSYGLMGMQERVAQLGGTIKFDSSPDGGFSVIVTLPPDSTENRSLI